MKEKIFLFHKKLLSRGIYSLAGKSILQLLLVAIIFGVLLYFAQTYINDFKGIINTFLQKWDWPFVLSLFFVSETLLGLVPPDFFIVWSNTTSHPMIMLSLLAILSYLGGMLAYFIGRRVASLPRINAWLMRKFSSHFATFHKYGGFLIVFSALFPLPFSTITMVTGMLDYPFKKVAILGTTRLIRYFGYALVLFNIF